MSPRVQFVRGTIGASRRRRSKVAALIAGILLACLAPLRAQEAPQGTIGRIEGQDISVEGGQAAGLGTVVNAPSIYVSNGSVVTVHSGRARMTLVTGGEIDVCGPAKFTLLQSSGAITVALNFGRLHVILPLATALRIFTPTIVATPLDISGGHRDITVGLDLSDSLCVVAASGALRLEQQFSGEILDVPQLGEFFLANGKLAPVAGAPGSCHCEDLEVRAAPPPPPPIPDALLDTRPIVAQNPPATPRPPAAADPEPPPAPLVSVGVLADANGAHPVPAPQKNAAPESPAVSVPEYKIVMPPLTFSANSPEPPPDPTPDLIMLVRTAHVERNWQFTGHVEAPHIEEVAQHNSAASAPPQPRQKPEKKKGGFWARLKRVFTGG